VGVRTRAEELHIEAIQALGDALETLGLVAGVGGQGADLVVVGPAGPVEMDVRAISVGDLARVQGLMSGEPSDKDGETPSAGRVTVVVADQLSEKARAALREGGWGYLDRRGMLWLRGCGLFINDTFLPGFVRRRELAGGPIRGGVAQGVALYLLIRPDQTKAAVRTIAAAVGASPSTVHDALRSLRDNALITADNSPLVPELFNALSEVWRPERVAVAREPNPSDQGLGLGLHDKDDPSKIAEQGWALSGDVGAAALGAPIVVGSAAAPDFYVPTSALLGRAVRRLGESQFRDRGASLAAAPSPLVTRIRRTADSTGTPWRQWPIAHPVVLALDLAQDLARGREILSDWNPEGATRVW
jgi:hypothetical protein